MANLEHFQIKKLIPPGLLKPKHNLPAQMTSFVGREREIADLKNWLVPLHRPGTANRLLTMTGAGGAGKTRLALQVATELVNQDHFLQGVWWVELAALNDPGYLPQTIAGVFGLAEQPDKTVLQALLDHLDGKEVL